METTANENFIDQITEEEKKARRWDDKLLGFRSFIIKTTSQVAANSIKTPSFPEQLIIKKNIREQVIIFSLLFLIFTVWLMAIVFKDGNFDLLLFIISVLFLSIMALIFYKGLTSKKYNYKIILSKEEIEIDSKVYRWDEISETFIVSRVRRAGFLFLIIGLRNGTLERYAINHLTGFSISETYIALAIEHYKRSFRSSQSE